MRPSDANETSTEETAMIRPRPIVRTLFFLWVLAGGLGAGEDENVNTLLADARRAFQSGRTSEGLKLAGRAIEAEPKNAAARSLRGSFHEALGRHAEAIADFDRAIELDPDQA